MSKYEDVYSVDVLRETADEAARMAVHDWETNDASAIVHAILALDGRVALLDRTLQRIADALEEGLRR